MQHFLEAQQLTRETLFSLIALADELRERPQQSLSGKIVATLFYEPSTRTRLSFESAATRLGATVLTTENARDFSSAAKGESLEDTARVIGSYSDCIVLRHFEQGAAARAASVSPVPIVNAGDGAGQHPTQALLDTYTIYRELGRLQDFTIAMVGDLKSGRTVRSLCYLLGKLQGITIILVSPKHLRMEKDVKDYLTRHDVAFRETDSFESILPSVDIVYMTRIQKERMDAASYEQAQGMFSITEDTIELLQPHARIMHPLPHLSELSLTTEREQTDPRVAYFREAENGLYARMALLHNILGPK